jgi:amino-acid N-acetyltransferase
MLSVEIRPATEGDHNSIRALLEQSGLPTDDLQSAAPEFVVAVHGSRLIGVGALQRFADTALLRSVAVLPEERGKGGGQQIVAALERAAREKGVRELALLTLTAADFFGRLGYRVVERSAVLGPICNSAEFRSLCPATAVCMSKTLSAAS